MQADTVHRLRLARDSVASAAPPIEFVLRGEHITLDALLKSTGLAPSGGAAKTMIASGRIEVDGQCETRRGRKLRAGQRVTVGAAQVRVLAAEDAASAGTAEPAGVDIDGVTLPLGEVDRSQAIEP